MVRNHCALMVAATHATFEGLMSSRKFLARKYLWVVMQCFYISHLLYAGPSYITQQYVAIRRTARGRQARDIDACMGVWTIRTSDYTYPGLFVLWVDYSYLGRFVRWTIRMIDFSYHGRFVQWTVHTIHKYNLCN